MDTQHARIGPSPHRSAPHGGPGRRIGFISTRFAGTDGVSLETQKWAQVLTRMGHDCVYFAGEADTPPERTYVVPEAFFGHPLIASLQETAFSQRVRPAALTRCIAVVTGYLKGQLAAFVRRFRLDLLIVENALTIPMHLPLGLALTELIAETGLPVIAHHHDFAWERQRFATNCVEDYLAMAFPPRLPSMQHVVINSAGAQQLSYRTGCSSTLIPNVMDFDRPPPRPDSACRWIRSELRLAPDERLVLQPTRVVQRKQIEHSLELVRLLGVPARLVISHASGDEGDAYARRVQAFAAMMGVRVDSIAHMIGDERGSRPDGRPIYSLCDIYSQADLVAYPSSIEGFGNAFLEAIYFRRPLVVNRYPVFEADILPKGFQVIAFEHHLTEAVVAQARRVLAEPELARAMAEHNYHLARTHFSYRALERHLGYLLEGSIVPASSASLAAEATRLAAERRRSA
jgi:glycosyltransferase involved in cell wall biosynthesis